MLHEVTFGQTDRFEESDYIMVIVDANTSDQKIRNRYITIYIIDQEQSIRISYESH